MDNVHNEDFQIDKNKKSVFELSQILLKSNKFMEPAVLQIDQIRNFISEITFTDPEKIKKDTNLFEEGIFDSLGFLSLISYLDEEFGIEVENDELSEENFESVQAVVEFISRKKNIG